MTIHKKGQAHWEGDIKRGKGTVSTESGVLNQQPYGFNTRFEGEKGTNPEELIGAAHAACFSMALSLMLGSSNGLQMLQTISIAAAFPFAFVMIFGMVSLVKGLREDVKNF